MVAVQADDGPIRPSGEQLHYFVCMTGLYPSTKAAVPIKQAAAGPANHSQQCYVSAQFIYISISPSFTDLNVTVLQPAPTKFPQIIIGTCS